MEQKLMKAIVPGAIILFAVTLLLVYPTFMDTHKPCAFNHGHPLCLPGDEHPQLVALNGVAVDVQAAEIRAVDLIQAVWGGQAPFTYEIIQDFDEWWLPSLPLECDDIGTQIYWVRALGQVHSTAPVETYIIVQDNQNVCGDPGP